MRFGLATAALLLLTPAAAPAQQAPAGASACTGCHGPVGRPAAIPSLDGRAAREIEQALEGFRAGARPATVMDRIARGFSAEESRAIALWFSARK